MKLLIVICDRNLTNKVFKILKEEKASYPVSFFGRGTADSSILAYLGLDRTEKEVILSIIDTQDIEVIMGKLGGQDFVKNHGAVAFTVPLDGISKNTLEFLKTLGVQQ